jgi:hypothetical protein
MKIYSRALAFATVASILSMPAFAQSPDNQATSEGHLAGANEAMSMVPAKAILSHTLVASNDRPDSTVEARIRNKVTLSDGTVLPAGAMLIGKVSQDDTQVAGMAKLALRFDQVRTKDGKVVPIKATIVGLYTPGSGDSTTTIGPDNNMPNTWTHHVLVVDQLSVASGVDLHSKIASNNSGVFVSTTKRDIKLGAGSELQLAIGPARTAS